jgi:membrane protein DedA with SNARE-associated domain
MGELLDLLGRWSYLGIPLAIALGNVGVPIPEDLVHLLAGSLAAQGRLRLPVVLLVGVLGVVLWDNLGYWVGRRLGRQWAGRLEAASPLGARAGAAIRIHGPLAVIAARFVPGARAVAGPLAGLAGVRPATFLAANGCAAVLHVLATVSAGYLLGGRSVVWMLRAAPAVGITCLLLVVLLHRRHAPRVGGARAGVGRRCA